MKLYRCDRCGTETDREGNCAQPSKRMGWITLYRVTRRGLAVAAHAEHTISRSIEPDLCDDCEESLALWWDNPTPRTATS